MTLECTKAVGAFGGFENAWHLRRTERGGLQGASWSLRVAIGLHRRAGQFSGGGFSTVSRRLARLEELGLVDAARMGAAFTAVRRYRLTPDGARCFMESEAYFHRTRRINQIACFLPAVEWFYRLAVKLPEMAYTGHFRSFHWCLRDGVDTMAHYDGGTVAFLWSGPRQTGSRLSARFEESGRSCDSTGGWPSIVCVVAADCWQACRVNETLPDFGLDDSSFVYCTETEMLSGNLAPRARMSLLSIHPLLSSPVNTFRLSCLKRCGTFAPALTPILFTRCFTWWSSFPGQGSLQ